MTMPHTTARPDFAPMAADMARQGWHLHRAHDTPPNRYQVMGERGCGTNIIRKVISKSLRIERQESLGWKHGFPQMVGVPQDMLVVCAVRAPQAWATSLFKRPWHATQAMQQLPFEAFIRAPWDSYIDKPDHFEPLHPELQPGPLPLQYDRHPLTGAPFPTIFDLRNAKHLGLLSFIARGANVMFFQMEPFNRDPEAMVGVLQDAFDLKSTERGYRPVKRRMGNLWKSEGPRPDLPEAWSDDDIAHMHAHLDAQTEWIMGYGD
ncbi:hypothetical protein KDD17_05705 [Sulfitobacter albidus]|uniref:Uncharacterized protein n=1 Tax=Sulfitobacter albidus TaxID=2829501 RepID=A0A975JFY7_9RHOB|nr:hypothetical protein [Sulfitobacter albidus]QUJ77486.1 hypothetical protein KDD17_05705 [Sulfitobacter albidus]